MKVIEYGQWKITVDVEKTKEYYKGCSRPESRSAKNLKLNLGALTDEEKCFFDSFGVDILSCYVEIKCFESEKEEHWLCKGEFPVCVESIVYPDEYFLPIDEVVERYQAGTLADEPIRIGRFRIEFSDEERSAVFMPEGFVCFEFFCDNINWLLDDPVDKIDYRERELQHYYETFSRLGIKACEIDKDLIDPYRNEWVEAFASPKKNIKKIKNVCSMYIWHIFSFGFLGCFEEDEAAESYDAQNKNECVFISNISDVAFVLEDARALTAKILNQFIDVTITAKDFSWTYCKTHECDCGPYFYKKNEA